MKTETKNMRMVCHCGRTIEMKVYDDIDQQSQQIAYSEYKTLFERVLEVLTPDKWVSTKDICEMLPSAKRESITSTLSCLYKKGLIERRPAVVEDTLCFEYIGREVE